ncbi:MAG: autotransporter outer membrane beta-barrel domain-containing protein [Novosphingobium sp.]|nr:autotransporter outer membrane beta-barrel domain-containing protein [Novosphingobium sp.]
MTSVRWLIAALFLVPALCSASANAQETSQVAQTARADSVEAAASDANDTAGPVVWVAGVSTGLYDRDGGPQSPYVTASITAYRGTAYERAAFTVYGSTLEQPDAALPSTYYLGSVGVGGNFDGWLVDAYASFGHQAYGLVETPVGRQRPTGSQGSGYFAAGLRVGRLLRPAPRLFVTPTIELQYARTRSLHHWFADGQPSDFEVPERALTGNLALRLDRAIGARNQHFIGVSFAHYESDNGLTALALDPENPDIVKAVKTADSWQQASVNGTFGLTSSLWLDLSAARTFGSVSGDSTSVSASLRLRF